MYMSKYMCTCVFLLLSVPFLYSCGPKSAVVVHPSPGPRTGGSTLPSPSTTLILAPPTHVLGSPVGLMLMHYKTYGCGLTNSGSGRRSVCVVTSRQVPILEMIWLVYIAETPCLLHGTLQCMCMTGFLSLVYV